MRSYLRNTYNILAVVLFAAALRAQDPVKPPAQELAQKNDTAYVLGPDDRITITALHADEISGKPFQVDNTGAVNLPMVGRVMIGGLTVPEAEAAVATSLMTYIEKPLVTVNVTEYQSQPVSVMGQVNKPGQYQVKGQKTLLDMLSMAEGLRPDAGPVAKITRRIENGRIPLTNVVEETSGRFTVAELKLKALMESKNPADNIYVKPHDVITIPKAELVYVVGEVNKSGGFVLEGQESLTTLQALALAGGITKTASTRHAKLLCAANGETANRKEIPVDLRKILEGKAPDMAVHAQDILFIPSYTPKNVAVRALEAAIQTGSGVIVWRSARY